MTSQPGEDLSSKVEKDSRPVGNREAVGHRFEAEQALQVFRFGRLLHEGFHALQPLQGLRISAKVDRHMRALEKGIGVLRLLADDLVQKSRRRLGLSEQQAAA